MKIIYLVESKFCQRDYDRFGLETLSNRGYKNIEVWDFSCYFRPEYYKTYTPADLLLHKSYISVPNKNFALQLLRSLSGSVTFISLIGINAKNLYIFKYLIKNQYRFGFVSFGHMPECDRKPFRKIRKALSNPSQGLKFFFDWIKVKFCTLGASIIPDFFILGGEVATKIQNSNLVNERTTFLKTHTFDYDLYLASKNTLKSAKKKKYAVFLDQHLPYHSDTISNRIVSASDYYPVLNDFFDYIGEVLDLEVIIAPHPRADYTKDGNPFNNRILSSQPISNLVKDADFIITHYSTSIAFAVLHNKPIFFITHEKYRSDIQECIKNIATFFLKNPIDISASNFNINPKDLNVNSEIYNEYKELYIKERNTPEKQTWDIFSDYLDHL